MTKNVHAYQINIVLELFLIHDHMNPWMQNPRI